MHQDEVTSGLGQHSGLPGQIPHDLTVPYCRLNIKITDRTDEGQKEERTVEGRRAYASYGYLLELFLADPLAEDLAEIRSDAVPAAWNTEVVLLEDLDSVSCLAEDVCDCQTTDSCQEKEVSWKLDPEDIAAANRSSICRQNDRGEATRPREGRI